MIEFLPVLVVLGLTIGLLLLPCDYDPTIRLREWIDKQ